MTAAQIAQLLTALLGSGSIGLFFYGRRKAKAEAENEAIRGSSMVVDMFKQLAELQAVEFREQTSDLKEQVRTLRNELRGERRRCDRLERAVRLAGIEIEE